MRRLQIMKIATNGIIFHMIISCLIAYGIWTIIYNNRAKTITRTVPITFYNIDDNTITESPEYIDVRLQSSWQQLRSIDYDQLAVHIDGHAYKDSRTLDIHEDSLLLPKSIKLVSYKPANNYITIQQA